MQVTSQKALTAVILLGLPGINSATFLQTTGKHLRVQILASLGNGGKVSHSTLRAWKGLLRRASIFSDTSQLFPLRLKRKVQSFVKSDMVVIPSSNQSMWFLLRPEMPFTRNPPTPVCVFSLTTLRREIS